MSSAEALFEILWNDYCTISPQAQAIHQLLADADGHVHNDHIALRTIADAHCDISVLARPFEARGYVFAGDHYVFEAKHLRARYLKHPDAQQPLVFISTLQLNELAPEVGTILRTQICAHPVQLEQPGRPWTCRRSDYERLKAHSEYAAWLYAFGWRANHFTVSLNHLDQFADIDALVLFLQEHGFALNEQGGVIKGSAAQGLRQASTLAQTVTVDCEDGDLQLPGCYVEFAQRYPMADGQLFEGFIASSADKIFESTDSDQQS